MHTPFHSLLAHFLKSTGLELELPSPEDLESFEFELEGMPCVVFPNADGTAAAARVFVQRFDAIPVARRSTAMRLPNPKVGSSRRADPRFRCEAPFPRNPKIPREGKGKL
jgi:hypothetical protein